MDNINIGIRDNLLYKRDCSYKTSEKILIQINHNTLAIVNKGKELAEPMENYYKPFHTSKQGLGLGIYIVKSILDIHQMKLDYLYSEGENCFRIR